MKKLWMLAGLMTMFIVASACRHEPNRVFRVMRECGFFETDDSHVLTCIILDANQVIIQTQSNEQALLTHDTSSITLNGSLYSATQPGSLIIASLEGITIISAQATTRIVQANAQVEIPLDENGMINGAPSAPIEMSIALDNEAIAQLPRQFKHSPEALFEDQVRSAAPQIEGCIAREDWTATYTVQRGDNLSRIAMSYAVLLEELQEANCILDSNRLATGQILRVPANVETDNGATSRFWADAMTLQQGQCTTLSWDVTGANTIFFEEQAVPEQASIEICPSRSTSYNLRVVYTSGRTSSYPLTISVTAP